MTTPRELLEVIAKQKTNRFVSVHMSWGKFHKPVKNVPGRLSRDDLLSLVGRISRSDNDFLSSIAKKHKSVNSFLRDISISPTPDLTPSRILENKQGGVTFTIECLPIKSQNPLKTKDTLPDLAEIACLVHFNEIGRILTERFNLPAKFKFLVEANIYGRLFEISPVSTTNFFSCLTKIQDEVVMGDFIQLLDWGKELSRLNGFEQKLEEQKTEVRKLLKDGSSKIEEEFKTIFPTIYMSIKPADDAKSIFTNFTKVDDAVLAHIENAKRVTANVMAFNRTRKLLNERPILFSGDLRATLTPAENKWAFYSIGPWSKLYPHHGIGLFDTKNNRVTVAYNQDVNQNLSDKGKLLLYEDIYKPT